MALHFGFAATAVASQALVNRCLNIYLTNNLANRPAQISRIFPVTVNGAPLSIMFSAEATLTSVRAELRRNTHSQVRLTLQMNAMAGASIPLNAVQTASYDVEVSIELDVTATLIALIANDQFQLGVDLPNSSVTAIRAFVGGGTLPPSYTSAIKQGLESSFVRTQLDNFLRNIAPSLLRATTTLVPAVYDITMPHPLTGGAPHPVLASTWFSVRVDVSRLVWYVLDRCIIAGVDVANMTSGNASAMYQYVHPSKGADLVSSANLDFVHRFFAERVLPVMRNGWIYDQTRLNHVHHLELKHVPTPTSSAVSGFEIYASITHYISGGGVAPVIVIGVTGDSGITAQVLVRGYPYLSGSRLTVRITHIDVSQPPWVSLVVAMASLLLVPVSLMAPFIFNDIMHNVVADLLNGINKGATSGGLDLRRDQPLPETPGPAIRFEPRYFGYNVNVGERYADLALDVGLAPAGRMSLTATLEEQGVSVPHDEPKIVVRVVNKLPSHVLARVNVPVGLVQPQDPTVRIRWVVYWNGEIIWLFTREQPLREPASKLLILTTPLIVAPDTLDQDITISCRVYRRVAGAAVEEFLNKSITILSVDPRPDHLKPYVQWTHNVKYWNGFQTIARGRKSKIHKAPGLHGCRFSNQYLLPHMRTKGKALAVRRFSGLPFPIGEIEKHRRKICPYCFFGGPDKGAFIDFDNPYDLTGVVGKVFDP